MADFISKLQYKICEKGEFFDEQPRDLEETLALIKAFPWDQQRGTDIQLSGPGIVIAGPNGDYLKVALYFNGKFSAYYMDPENHLYEYHTADLNEECRQVKEFFDGSLNLEGFDKHFFNIGNRAHFTTQTFEYGVGNWQTVITLSILLIISVLIITAMLSARETFGIVIGTIMLLMILTFTLLSFLSFVGVYIKISKGHDEFLFGLDKKHIYTYNKQDVKEVIVYENRSSGRGISLDRPVNEIVFKDGTILKVPGVVLSSLRLSSKFREDMVRIEWVSSWIWD